MAEYVWKIKGYDNGYSIYPTNEWNELSHDKAVSCEYAYQNKTDNFSTNGGEYQFNIKEMYFYVIDSAFCSENIELKRELK